MTTCLLYLARRLSPDSDAGVTSVGTLQSDDLLDLAPLMIGQTTT